MEKSQNIPGHPRAITTSLKCRIPPFTLSHLRFSWRACVRSPGYDICAMAPRKSGSAQWRNGARTRSNPHPPPLTRKNHPNTTSDLRPSSRETLASSSEYWPTMGEGRAAGEMPSYRVPVAGPRVERWQLGAVLSFMNFWFEGLRW